MTDEGPPKLEVIDLSRSFGGVKANQGITLRVAAGEIHGVIGPNGAGKTTLINVLSGIYRPQAGDVRLDGESIIGLSPMRISLKGMVRTFQTPKLFRSMSLHENLMLPALARAGFGGHTAVRRAEQRAVHLLGLIRLTHHRNQPAGVLSGGEQALLQVATGLMIEDLSCYLLDEPFAGINPVLKERIVELIQQEGRMRGITFLIVSHEMTTIRQICGRVSVLAEGRLLMEGTLDEVVADQRVIAAYLSAPKPRH